MKITVKQLRRIIKEEVSKLINESADDLTFLSPDEITSYSDVTSWLSRNAKLIEPLDPTAKAEVREKFIEMAIESARKESAETLDPQQEAKARRAAEYQFDSKFKAPAQVLGTRPPEYYQSRSRHGDGSSAGMPRHRLQPKRY